MGVGVPVGAGVGGAVEVGRSVDACVGADVGVAVETMGVARMGAEVESRSGVEIRGFGVLVGSAAAREDESSSPPPPVAANTPPTAATTTTTRPMATKASR